MKKTSADSVSHSMNVQVYVLHPKQDLHGLGFDPFKHAPEFRGIMFLYILLSVLFHSLVPDTPASFCRQKNIAEVQR